MKKYYYNKLIALAALSLLILGCDSSEIEEPIDQNLPPNEIIEWDKLDGIDRRILNGKVFNQKIHLIGNGEFFYDVSNKNLMQSFRPFLTVYSGDTGPLIPEYSGPLFTGIIGPLSYCN